MDVDLETLAELDEPITDSDDVLDIVQPSDYQAGDLVELSDDTTRDTSLAVCLGYINGAFHLFTQSGRWNVVLGFKPRFVVPNFVDKETLEPLIAKLPTENLSYEAMSSMSKTEFAPDRAAGGQLLSQMAQFLQAAEEVTQKFGVTLDRIHGLLTHAKTNRYLTLMEIHRVLFDGGKKAPATPSVLYAIHRAVVNNPLCFRIVSTIGDSKTQLFEVIPSSDVALIQNLQTLVRRFTDLPGKQGKSLSALTPEDWQADSIGQFIHTARQAIDQSRACRDFTPYGMVGPAKHSHAPVKPAWTGRDLSILHFMRIWVCYDQFPPTSTYHWIGAAILRATGRYTDSEYLSTSVGWTFLQEVGYISPWDLHTRHLLRLPDIEVSRVKGFAPLELGPTGIEEHIGEDRFDALERHDWKDMRAFAIDSKDTVDVDDAISVEPTDVPEETWIHIHVADPASRIRPDSLLAKRAEKSPLTLYLSGHQSSMWGVESGLRNLFSLAPNTPCLTFSGKINLHGEILDHKITPGILRSFVYMTPEEANKTVGTPSANVPKAESFSVGKPPAERPAGRPMTAAADLQPEDRKSIHLLHRFSKALHERRLAKGAMPVFPPEPGVSASFEDNAIQVQTISEKYADATMLHCNGDPFLEIGWPKAESLLVSSTMRLAGEIAAQWCGERNIPLPYITQPEAQKNLAILQSFTENVLYPMMANNETIDVTQNRALFRLLGPDQLSTKPAPYFLMGVDGYAKVTSPLRRYSDLLAHWQIEDALLQEAATGRVDVAQLPFQAETLETDVFPWMRMRQRIIRRLDKRKGQLGYMLQALVRAWKYPDEYSTPVPETFRFTVRTRSRMTDRTIQGVLDWFMVPASMSIDALPDLGVKADAVVSGDVFEVRLADVNVHLEMTYVEAVSKVKIAADEAGEEPKEISTTSDTVQ